MTKGDTNMKRFQVPEKLPKTPTTENKSIRFPISMIEEVEAEIQGKNSSFSAFVIAATRAALDDLREQREHKA